MLKSYLKTALRNIVRNKIYTAINVLGLSLGLCACIVIYVIVNHEFSFDTFHPGKERIYRVMADVTESTGDKLHFAKVPVPVAINGKSQLTGIEAIAALIPYNVKIAVPGTDNTGKNFENRNESSGYITTAIAESSYFNVFSYDWLAGNANTALQAPSSVVLTETRARQYFGNIPYDKMIGKRLVYGDSLPTQVTGIIKQWKGNTDLPFSDFISFSTVQNGLLNNNINITSWKQNRMSAWAFIKLKEGTKAEQVNSQMAAMVKTSADPETKLSLWLEPLSAIHFNADIIENPIRTAHRGTLYSLIALFILILAIINFINLSTAQSIRRAKEVGIRKVLGSGRISLVARFLSETIVLAIFSVTIAVSLTNPVLSWFHSFIPEGVTFHLFQSSTIGFLLLVIIITSLFAGLYPAIVLSSALPVLSLKGGGPLKGSEKWLLRKGLIVFQFTVSLVFIIGSIVIARQLKYVSEKDLGFSSDAIVTIDTPRGDSLSKVTVLEQKIREVPAVGKTALQWLSPMTDNPREMKLKLRSTDEKDFWVKQVAGNEEFIPLYNIKLLAGRNLVKSDSVNELVINESLSRFMGNKSPHDALGKMLYWNDKPYPVVGIVADFHTKSLHEPITPLCIINRREREGSIAIKLRTKGKQFGVTTGALSQIESKWKEIYPANTFKYSFYDESLAALYGKDRQTATLINTSTLITIFISCIGLFGLALFTVEKRAKEISIRKVLGAGITSITILLTKDFVLLITLSFCLASPIAWYLMDRWLQDFAYRVDIRWWMFVLAGMSAIVIAILTLSFQVIKAAMVAPAKNLRADE